ncbi:MAG: hypothetical protein AAGH15_09885 [Myxococcota bacterium]
MIHSHYDVIVLGTSLRGLLSGALLAKRGFRVLVLGQGELPFRYAAGGRTWPRRPYTFLAAHSPVARRVLSELTLLQLFRRRAAAMDPSFQVLLPRQRFDVTTEPAFLGRELEREFPAVKRALEDFHASVRRRMGELDRVMERDLVFPPETFLERRELARATAHLPADGDASDPLAELALGHPFRQAVATPAAFASDLDPSELPVLGGLRGYGAWWLGSARLEGGYEWLESALVERITTANGEVRRRESVESIEVRRGVVQGVTLSRAGERISCGHLVAAGSALGLRRLLPDRGAALGELFERLGEPTARRHRYVLHALVRAEAVPEGLARNAFLVGPEPSAETGRVRLELGPMGETHEDVPVRRLTAEVLTTSDHALGALRERLLARLEDAIPFLREHLLLVDSPHDGRGVDDVRTGTELPVDEPWSRGPSTMTPLFAHPVRGALGVTGLPLRTPLKRLLLGGPHAAPGLGEEGAFLTAWGVARIIAHGDRRRTLLRRQARWSKLEL